jgi:DNA-binding NarL/FixJ family response regulator
MHRVIVVDDHKSFRESLAIAVGQMGAFSFVGLLGNARQACALIETEKPDLVVVDVSLEDSDGIALAWELRRRKLNIPIMMLTMHTSGLLVREALEAGARGYATKNQPLTEITQAMEACIAGARYISPLVGAIPEETKSSGDVDTGLTARLSRREREIFSHIIRGHSSEEIGRSLSISLKTVETHRTHINRKLGVHSPAQLIRLAALRGLLMDVGPGATRGSEEVRQANGQGEPLSAVLP